MPILVLLHLTQLQRFNNLHMDIFGCASIWHLTTIAKVYNLVLFSSFFSAYGLKPYAFLVILRLHSSVLRVDILGSQKYGVVLHILQRQEIIIVRVFSSFTFSLSTGNDIDSSVLNVCTTVYEVGQLIDGLMYCIGVLCLKTVHQTFY